MIKLSFLGSTPQNEKRTARGESLRFIKLANCGNDVALQVMQLD
jgi:hypothetical protein